MTPGLPPIVKLASRLLVDIERAVRGFPRYHRYAIGADLREDAREVQRAARRAWRDRPRQLARVNQLAKTIDELKDSLQLGKEVEAFRSFGEFEALARVAAELGRQCGGWRRQLRSKSQNARDICGPPAQRAQILSARTASQGAHP